MKNINSLRDVSKFKRVYNEGKSLANKYLVVYVLPNEGDFRLGISVSKKVGNSVIRHHVTRLIRESYMAYKQILPDGYDVVVIGRPAVKDKNFETVKKSLEHLLKMHGLI